MAGELLRNYTREVVLAIKKDGWDGEDEYSKLQWSYAGSLLFSVTVITTIGIEHRHLLPESVYSLESKNAAYFIKLYFEIDCLDYFSPIFAPPTEKSFPRP